ncbi:NarK/NasA family nitrate transporter [Aliidiomarina halalkaliphila]|uniref:NarK/NasA family nitrate transporter n=2 Tax=Aliidiomarina halalkaliphila TaxID=2593535 RepID=A0A552X669_9GAMM|nr:nitrate/nitrite transporter [Aliidiomarina halalkaliphila]TRW50511.1 NarK/NasA family nitrate transporter [Aliidiomarina halalkaliphila]
MDATLPRAWQALAMATLAFAANFSVWILYAVLAINIQRELNLSGVELGLLLSAPMLSGAILRIPVGILCEYMGARTLWIWQMLITIPALLFLPFVDSYIGFIGIGLWIGLSGVSFTLGVRYVTDWFARSQQGLALGIFGAGNAGAAISFVLLPLFVIWFDWPWTGPLYALGLTLMLLVFIIFAPKTPSYIPRFTPPWREQLRPLKDPRVWRFSLYYYFVFGSFLALIMWLPHYYMQAYQLEFEQAMAFTLFFVTTSSMVRALGGWLADRYGGQLVNWSVFWVCLVCLFFLSYPPTTMTIHGIDRDVIINIEINVWVFTALMFVIGIAQGLGRASVFKVIHNHYPKQMGSVGGIVAAIGGLGGFTLPILFGLSQDMLGISSAAFMVLYAVLAVCMTVMFLALRAERYRRELARAQAQNFFEDE